MSSQHKHETEALRGSVAHARARLGLGGAHTEQINRCNHLPAGMMRNKCIQNMITEGPSEARRVTQVTDSDLAALKAAAERRALGQNAGAHTKQANTCNNLEGPLKAACVRRMASEGLDDATRVTEVTDSDLAALKVAAARRAAGQVAGRGRKRRKSSKKPNAVNANPADANHAVDANKLLTLVNLVIF